MAGKNQTNQLWVLTGQLVRKLWLREYGCIKSQSFLLEKIKKRY